MRHLSVLILSIVFLNGSTTFARSSVSAAASQPRLAFEALVDGNWEIYVWDRQKSTNITHSPSNDFSPVWSKDGRLAFLSTTSSLDYEKIHADSDPTLYVWDGTNSTRVGIVDGVTIVPPKWSPKGQLAYVGDVNGSPHVFVWNGTDSVDVLPNARLTTSPAWAADERLAFVGSGSVGEEVYVWDGKIAVNVSQHDGNDYAPSWGPDGKLAFVSYRDGKTREIYVWDGKSLTNVSHSAEDDYPGMAWSDKGYLAWTSASGVLVWDRQTTRQILKDTAFVIGMRWGPENRLLMIYNDKTSHEQAVVWDGKSQISIGRTMTIGFVGAGGPSWISKGRIALLIVRALTPDEMQGPGGTETAEMKIWDNGVLTPLKDADSAIDGVWSSDDWLAWTAPSVNGDAVGANHVYVWNGKTVIPMEPNSVSASENPRWEPTH